MCQDIDVVCVTSRWWESMKQTCSVLGVTCGPRPSVCMIKALDSYSCVDNLNCTTPINQQNREFPPAPVMSPVLSLSPNTEGIQTGQRTSVRVLAAWLTGQSVSNCHFIHQKATPHLRLQIISPANSLSSYFHAIYSLLPIEIGLLTHKISHWRCWRHPTLKHIGYSQFKTDRQTKGKKRLTQCRATFLSQPAWRLFLRHSQH